MDTSTPNIALSIIHDDMGTTLSAVRTRTLKRRVDRSDDDRHAKRIREDTDDAHEPPASADTTLVNDDDGDGNPNGDPDTKGKARGDTRLIVADPVGDRGTQLADEVESELRCGCCTEIAYNPVDLSPCHHFFCGSCMALHLSHSRAAPNYTRATCPACRTHLTNITPSRVVQSLVAALVRVYPERARTDRERAQADEIYTAGRDIPIPPPRASNPDLLLPQQQNSASDNLARPCPHCAPNNSFEWTCPRPIPNPDTDRANAWNIDNGPPPGHNYCGACDELYAIGAPTSSRCDMCTTGFCGISVPQVCRSYWLHQVRLLSDYNSLQGLIESGRVYEIFNGNSTEVEILFDYLREAEITPNMIYLDIIDYILATPEGFEPLITNDVFRQSHPAEMRVPDAQYAAARAGNDSSSSLSRDMELPSVLFAEFTDEEDSDGEGEREDERRRTGVSASGAGTIEASSTTVLPRLADLMRSMRDPDMSPSLTLPAVSRGGAPRAAGASSSSVALSSSTLSIPTPASSTSTVPASSAPRRRRICRECATEVFMNGLKDWWAREMHTVIGRERLPVWVVARKMCEHGEVCTEQSNYDHAKAFCHITPPGVDASANRTGS